MAVAAAASMTLQDSRYVVYDRRDYNYVRRRLGSFYYNIYTWPVKKTVSPPLYYIVTHRDAGVAVVARVYTAELNYVKAREKERASLFLFIFSDGSVL